MKLNKLFVKASVIMKINSNLKKIATAGIALLIIICAFTPVVSSQVEKSSTIWNIFEETTENTYSNEHPMSGNRVHSLLNTFVWIILNLINNIGNKPLVTILYNALTRLSTENNEINDIDPNTNINNNKLSTKKMITTPNPPKPLADDWNVTLDFIESNPIGESGGNWILTNPTVAMIMQCSVKNLMHPMAWIAMMFRRVPQVSLRISVRGLLPIFLIHMMNYGRNTNTILMTIKYGI